MKTERNILIAFIHNLFFSVFEFLGGIFTGSVAIVSDAVHDAGDAISIGISYFLEKKSKKEPDEKYTYGYTRYSVLGGFITTIILLIGSVVMIYNAIIRFITPAQIDYNGMIIFAIVGVCVNFSAVLFTRKGDSINQKAVNLHMLEDVLGWIVVLSGAIIMRFFDFTYIDSIMCIGVSIFIFINAIQNLKKVMELFFEKVPFGFEITEIKESIKKIDGVIDVHHIHIWSMDGENNFATMHIISDEEHYVVKNKIRQEMHKHRINHITIEMETSYECCCEKYCKLNSCTHSNHNHH